MIGLTHICLVDFFHLYILDESISNFRGVCYIFLHFNRNSCKETVQTLSRQPRSVLGLHCLPMFLNGDARLILNYGFITVEEKGLTSTFDYTELA